MSKNTRHYDAIFTVNKPLINLYLRYWLTLRDIL